MTRATLLQVLARPTALGPAEVRELEQLAQAFPYCQTAHLLLAKAAHDHGTMLAGQRLRRAATYAADRTLLRRLIEEVAPEPVAEPQPERVSIAEAAPHEIEAAPAALVSEQLVAAVTPVAEAPAQSPPPAAVVPSVIEAEIPAAPALVAPAPMTAQPAATAPVAQAPLAAQPVLAAQGAPVTPEVAAVPDLTLEAAPVIEVVALVSVQEPATPTQAAQAPPQLSAETPVTNVAAVTVVAPVAMPIAETEVEATLIENTPVAEQAAPTPVAEQAAPAEAVPAPIAEELPEPEAAPAEEATEAEEAPVAAAAVEADILPVLVDQEDAHIDAAAPVAELISEATPEEEPDLPAQAPAIRPPVEVGEARFEFGLAEPPPPPPAYELPGLIDEWAASAVTLSLAGPEPAADSLSSGSKAAPVPPVLTPAAFTGDATIGYGFGESSRLGFSMQLLDLLTDKAEKEAAETLAAEPPAAPLPPAGAFFEPDPLLLDHWATHSPPAPVLPSSLDLINNFLKRQPRLTRAGMLPPAPGGQTDLSVRSTRAEPDLVSENLARIFVRQGKTVRAIEIYEKLIVKQPEKTAHFTAQIEALKLQPPII